jgi:hypothetical protein
VSASLVRESLRHRPFYQRAYAGFTPRQQAFYEDLLEPETDVLDPLGGQAFALARAAHQGRRVTIGDVNMAPLLLALLRDPERCRRGAALAARQRVLLEELPDAPSDARMEYCQDWLHPSVADNLVRLAELLELPVDAARTVALADLREDQQMGLAMAVFAARDITCYRGTDNVTWTKPGGLARHLGIKESLLQALAEWEEFAGEQTERDGHLDVVQMDVTKSEDLPDVSAELVVTSPPYANRLDYFRMWGPEVAVLRAIPGLAVCHRERELGSNMVRGWKLEPEQLRSLPESVNTALKAIHDDDAPYSDTYYFPYFAQYATGLANAMRHCARLVAPGGTLVVFVRDTVRRDILFPTSDIVRHAATYMGLEADEDHHEIVRRHIGLRRRNAPASIHGLAQREWTLTFRS